MIQKQADITFQDHAFFVKGDLTFTNVMALYEKSLLDLMHCPQLRFDFSQLHSSDSAGLALVIEWMKLAEQSHKKIQFDNVSDDLMSIAKAAGLNGFIKTSSR